MRLGQGVSTFCLMVSISHCTSITTFVGSLFRSKDFSHSYRPSFCKFRSSMPAASSRIRNSTILGPLLQNIYTRTPCGSNTTSTAMTAPFAAGKLCDREQPVARLAVLPRYRLLSCAGFSNR